jgi:hypothetical protein
MKPILVLLSMLGLGCSASFDRASLREEVAGESMQVKGGDIEAILKTRPQLPSPFRLAIYFSPLDSQLEWNKDERAAIRQAARELEEKGIVSDIFFVPEHLVGYDRHRRDRRSLDEQRRCVRLAAARHRSDAVLIVRAAADVDSYVNPLSALYLTIVGLWIAPGTHTEALVLVDGTLWDVRNEFLYMSVSTEGEGGTVRPEMYARERDAITVARKKAVKSLADEIVQLAADATTTSGGGDARAAP